MGKLRQHASKQVADLAKELVRKWKTDVEREKQQHGNASGVKSKSSTPTVKTTSASHILF